MIPFKSWSKHIVGGEITYDYVGVGSGGGNLYDVYLTMYRDCNSTTPFDDEISLSFFNASNNNLVKNATVLFQSSQQIPITSYNPCVVPPSGICYDKSTYATRVELPASNNGYYVSWQRCCRNETITNIVDPGTQGLTLTTFFPATNIINSSPRFNDLPPMFICVGDTFNFNHSAFDPDGDVLVYSLVNPLHGADQNSPAPQQATIRPYQTVPFLSPYSLANALGGSQPLTINSNTGVLSAIAQTQGQFVFAVNVREYRNNVLLSEVTRELQVNVTFCQPNVAPNLTLQSSPLIQGDTLTFIEGQPNCFPIKLQDPNSLDSIFIFGNGIIFDNSSAEASLQDSSRGIMLPSLCWQPNCDQIGLFTPFTIYYRDNYKCPKPNVDSTIYWAKVIPGIPPAPTLQCVSVINPNQIQLTWLPVLSFSSFVQYEIWRNDGTGFIKLDSVQNINSSTYIDIQAFDNQNISYQYYIRVVKNCNGLIVYSDGNSVSSMTIQINQLQAQTFEVKWTNFSNGVTYELMSNDGGNDLLETSTQNLFYQKTICNFNGSFRVRVRHASGCYSYSAYCDTISVVNDLPFATEFCGLNVSVNNDGIQLNWKKSDISDLKHYRILRKSGNNFTPITTTQDTFYFDSDVQVLNQSYCYAIEVVDLCDQSARSETFCSVVLQSYSEPYFVDLNWNTFNNPFSVTQYDIFTNIGTSETDFQSLTSQNILTFHDENIDVAKGKYCYRVQAQAAGGCGGSSWSNVVCESFPVIVYFPNAFSPNADGMNDELILKSIFVESIDLQIFDRWGQMIYQATDPYFKWDGKHKNGKEVPEGVFAYRMKINGFDGKKLEKFGTITLIR